MNSSITRLSLSSVYINSPLIQTTLNSQRMKLTMANSFFSRISNTIYSSIPNSQSFISSSRFENILNGAIKINSLLTYGSKIFNSQLELYENYFFMEKCKFYKCTTTGMGGGIESNRANFTVKDIVFEKCSAKCGGAAHILRSWECNFERVLVAENTAEYAAGIHYDAMNEQNTTNFNSMNFTSNKASKWTGSFRIDHGGGKVTGIIIHNNEAMVSSGYFDYTWYPVHKTIKFIVAINNSCISRGAAITFFHIKHRGALESGIFVDNKCEKSAHSISLENVDGIVTLTNCYFTGPQSEEIYSRYNETEITFVGETNHFNIYSEKIITIKGSFLSDFQEPQGV